MAVSAPNEDGANDAAPEAGAVYVYARSAGAWSHQVYLKGANTEQFDEFGSSVALSRDGRTMAVGARFDEQAGSAVSDSGGVYLSCASSHPAFQRRLSPLVPPPGASHSYKTRHARGSTLDCGGHLA